MRANEKQYLQRLIQLYDSWTVVMDSEFQRTRAEGAKDALIQFAKFCDVEVETENG